MKLSLYLKITCSISLIFIVVFLIQQQHTFTLRIVTIPTKGSIEIELNNSQVKAIIAAIIKKAEELILVILSLFYYPLSNCNKI